MIGRKLLITVAGPAVAQHAGEVDAGGAVVEHDRLSGLDVLQGCPGDGALGRGLALEPYDHAALEERRRLHARAAAGPAQQTLPVQRGDVPQDRHHADAELLGQVLVAHRAIFDDLGEDALLALRRP